MNRNSVLYGLMVMGLLSAISSMGRRASSPPVPVREDLVPRPAPRPMPRPADDPRPGLRIDIPGVQPSFDPRRLQLTPPGRLRPPPGLVVAELRLAEALSVLRPLDGLDLLEARPELPLDQLRPGPRLALAAVALRSGRGALAERLLSADSTLPSADAVREFIATGFPGESIRRFKGAHPYDAEALYRGARGSLHEDEPRIVDHGYVVLRRTRAAARE